MLVFMNVFFIINLPFACLLLLRIWRPGLPSSPGKSVSDRIGWSFFAFGICLMLTMVLFASLSESDGDFRSWETIRLHRRVFLAIAVIPLFIYLYQAARPHPHKLPGKESPFDDLG
jgi:hypothetical protein